MLIFTYYRQRQMALVNMSKCATAALNTLLLIYMNHPELISK